MAMLFNALKKLRNSYILNKYRISYALWRNTLNKIPVAKKLNRKELRQLRKITTLFLHAKVFTGVQGFQLDDEKRLIIAIQACIPILKLDLDYYDGFIEIVVYPDAFIVNRDIVDDSGLVHNTNQTLSGEAWSKGPVVLSWKDIELDSFNLREGHNVIIHEFSHKLDMLNGRANGMPPLHPNMHRQEWTDSLSQAYDHLLKQIEYYDHSYINNYAATNPAEFFAVISEYFFTAPNILKQYCPDVYKQLVLFYKQTPA